MVPRAAGFEMTIFPIKSFAVGGDNKGNLAVEIIFEVSQSWLGDNFGLVAQKIGGDLAHLLIVDVVTPALLSLIVKHLLITLEHFCLSQCLSSIVVVDGN